MNQVESEKEYNEFIAKFAKAGKDFIDDFNKLSPENKRKFQSVMNTFKGKSLSDFFAFLNTKF